MDEVQVGPQSKNSVQWVEDISEQAIQEILNQESLGQQEGSESPASVILRPGKRYRTEIDNDERDQVDNDGFTVVQKKLRQKRLSNNTPLRVDTNKNQFEVSITSYQLLPKQIGFAKLLKSEGISSATRIRYKNAYKALVCFEDRKDALELINNTKLFELGFRCHFTNEVDLTHGIVKYLEVELSDEELKNAFTAEYPIVSVKRLKRLTDDGEWVNSETVRFDFKSAVLPPYVYGYECRFKIEPFTFPVSQCSMCWRYGHLVRSCPSKKPICPKCGKNHSNCDTTEFKCVNCRGHHISFEKTCPTFLREKEIRRIMSVYNITYKMALSKYSEDKEQRSYNYRSQHQNYDASFPTPSFAERTETNMPKPSYSKVVQQEEEDTEYSSEDSQGKIKETPKKKKKKNQTRTKSNDNGSFPSFFASTTAGDKKENQHAKKKEEDRKTKEQFSFARILRKLKESLLSEVSFEEKIQNVLKLVLEEIVSYCVRVFSHGDGLSKLFGFFNDG